MKQDNYKMRKCNGVYKNVHIYKHRLPDNAVKIKSVFSLGVFIIFLLQFTELVESDVNTEGDQSLLRPHQ